MGNEFLFVYGSLRKLRSENMNHILFRDCEYFKNGFIQGILYEIICYPGAVESEQPNDKVYGELYRILNSENLFPILDEYEECSAKYCQPHEYIRKKVSVKLLDGGSLVAWVYIFNHSTLNRLKIESGDYSIYIRAAMNNHG
jgi:gamma-glutamylcyclotransferase (GGCT)/AIG2-like uncharacterized protein YtfP